jgi:hypothetical protein
MNQKFGADSPVVAVKPPYKPQGRLKNAIWRIVMVGMGATVCKTEYKDGLTSTGTI